MERVKQMIQIGRSPCSTTLIDTVANDNKFGNKLVVDNNKTKKETMAKHQLRVTPIRQPEHEEGDQNTKMNVDHSDIGPDNLSFRPFRQTTEGGITTLKEIFVSILPHRRRSFKNDDDIVI